VKLGCASECLNGLDCTRRVLYRQKIDEEEEAERVSRVIFMEPL
jgi:hypothetical protein